MGLDVTITRVQHALAVAMGPRGLTGPTGDTGSTGPGVAAGGSTGQALVKTSGTDYATAWAAPTPAGHAASHASAGTDPVTIAEAQVTGLVADLAGKASLGSSPVFTGTVAASGLAGSLLSAASPVMNGVAAAGTGVVPSRQDHVHPSDTSRAPTASPSFTGRVTVASGAANGISQSGTLDMVGTGSPEGVVTAPVGSTWRDTNATTGAVRWVKAIGSGNTGWRVDYGDTGRRNIATLATVNATATYSVIHLRRSGQVVHLALEIANSVTSTAHEFLPSLPAGFKPATGVTFGGGRNTSTLASTAQISVSASGQSYMYAATASFIYAAATWITDEAWPSSLPGTAA